MDVQLFMLRLQRRGQRSGAKNLPYIASMSAVASSRVFGSATLCAAQTAYRTFILDKAGAGLPNQVNSPMIATR